MALDGGGSSEMAFNAQSAQPPLRRRRARGRRVAQLVYYRGLRAPARSAVFSPNGDGYPDVQRSTPSSCAAPTSTSSSSGPDDTVKWSYQARPRPGHGGQEPDPRARRRRGSGAGSSRRPTRQARDSEMSRPFVVELTLGYLTLSRSGSRVRAGHGGRCARHLLQATHGADVKVTIERDGRVVRHLLSDGPRGRRLRGHLERDETTAGGRAGTGATSSASRAESTSGRWPRASGFRSSAVSWRAQSGVTTLVRMHEITTP